MAVSQPLGASGTLGFCCIHLGGSTNVFLHFFAPKLQVFLVMSSDCVRQLLIENL